MLSAFVLAAALLGQKVSDLPALTTPDAADYANILDVSDTSIAATGRQKKVLLSDLAKGLSASNLTTGTLAVANGGTGRATSTTAYGLIAAGTTATGPHQTLAAGATTEILVGGGASSLPVWTTATGSDAPVRATSPTLVTPIVTTIYGSSAANGDITIEGTSSATKTSSYVILQPTEGNVMVGHTGTALGKFESRATSAQIAASYNDSNYGTLTVGATGICTWDATGSGASFVFSDQVAVKGLVLDYSTSQWSTNGTLSAYAADNWVYLNGTAVGLLLNGDGTAYQRIQVGGGASNAIVIFTANNERCRVDASGNVIVGHSGTALGKFESRATSAQIAASYNDSNYGEWTVGSTGINTFNAVGSGASFVFSDPVTIGSDTFVVTTAKTPASAADTGTQGQIAWDASFIYVCTATNTWKRVAIATW